MKNIKQVDLKGKKVVLRVDFNVTLDSRGKIIDDIKLRSTLPTINYLLGHGAKRIVLVTHFGRPIVRPKERVANIIEGNKNLTVLPIIEGLAKLLAIDYTDLKPEYITGVALPVYKLSDKIWILENIRFDAREEINDTGLAMELASFGDIYVDDAFGNVHRKHSSMVAITKHLPSYAGLLLFKEYTTLGKLIENPGKPFVLILGGAKVDEKILTLAKLLKRSNKVLLGGMMANTFLASRDVDMGNSAYEKESVDSACELYGKSASKFYLPTDLVWRNKMAVDIGKATIEQYKKIIATAETIFWNGTMGLTSLGNFKYAIGTHEIIRAIVDSPAKTKVICGGDTIAEVSKLNLIDKMTHVSTGGGSSLAFLAGKKMPAIEALEDGGK